MYLPTGVVPMFPKSLAEGPFRCLVVWVCHLRECRRWHAGQGCLVMFKRGEAAGGLLAVCLPFFFWPSHCVPCVLTNHHHHPLQPARGRAH